MSTLNVNCKIILQRNIKSTIAKNVLYNKHINNTQKFQFGNSERQDYLVEHKVLH